MDGRSSSNSKRALTRLQGDTISPNRVKNCVQRRLVTTKMRHTNNNDYGNNYNSNESNMIKKVQVVYYLSRNGQLEHPHYIEVPHLANQPLRLRDFTSRLTVLRGQGMPSLYSWSCKRSYKNGYVWNDLAENDIIYPCFGAEYVLKGSQLVPGCSERFELVNDASSNKQLIHRGSNIYQPEMSRNIIPSNHQRHHSKRFEDTRRDTKFECDENNYMDEQHESEEEFEEEEEKKSDTTSTTPHSFCSRGVSTDEPLEILPIKHVLASESTKKDSVTEPSSPPPSRNSVLLQLFSCGSNLAPIKAKNPVSPISNANKNCMKQQGTNVTKKSSCGSEVKTQNVDLHKAVFNKTTVIKVANEDHGISDGHMVRFMSENPRFGNLQSEEKEYFSGSIVESMSQESRVVKESPLGLKRSNSYNEERNCKPVFEEEETVKEDISGEKGLRGKCIPLNLFK